MSAFLENIKDYVHDPLNNAPLGILGAKTGGMTTEPCRVLSYDPLTHTARVTPMSGSATGPDGEPLGMLVKVGTDLQMPLTGTGRAHALFPGQYVLVEFPFGKGGLRNQGYVKSTLYTQADQKPPASASFMKSGTGYAEVMPREDGTYGNAKHLDGNSNLSEVVIGKVNREEWGHEHTMTHGTNMPLAEEQMREAATAMLSASDKLMGLV